jgi:hypothetical protein
LARVHRREAEQHTCIASHYGRAIRLTEFLHCIDQFMCLIVRHVIGMKFGSASFSGGSATSKSAARHSMRECISAV